MKIYKDFNFSTLYRESLLDLMTSPEYETKPRGFICRENTDVALVLENPLSCLYENLARSSQKKYIAAELVWYFMGRNDVDFIKKYAKFWESIQNPDGTVNSAYGNLIFTKQNSHGFSQYSWALFSLLNDRDSRQAVLHFNLPEHQYSSNRDFVCTMYGIFQIRNNRLNFKVSMRSNDAVLGLPTDIAFFTTLQSQMLLHLSEKYPGLELGTYTHLANSFHVYEHHFEKVEAMLQQEFRPAELPAVGLELIDQDAKPSELLKSLFDRVPTTYQDALYSWISNYYNGL